MQKDTTSAKPLTHTTMFITPAHMQQQFDSIPAREIPESMEKLAEQLRLKIDTTGIRSINPAFDSADSAVTPVSFATPEQYTIADILRSPHTISVVAMSPSQAASFAIDYIAGLRADSLRSFDAIGDASIPGHTMWIPFSEHTLCTTPVVHGALRIYVRNDASIELFVYPATDDSFWDFGEDYLVAYHRA